MKYPTVLISMKTLKNFVNFDGYYIIDFFQSPQWGTNLEKWF